MPYPIKKLGDCLVQFDRGISWSRKDEGGAIAVLRIPNIQEGHINLDDLKYISAKNGNGELLKNDIVMVASNGNPDLVGRSALVTEKEGGTRFASFLIRLRFDSTKLLPQYAHLFLLTPTFKRELRRKIATTSGIYNLKKDHIEKIKIPLPSLKVQKQIVERLDKIAEAQKLQGELIQKADELFQSLLHQELNPAGKDWEMKKLGEVLEYEQPTKYLVISTDYKDEYPIPVLTAGKSFVLGNTNEKDGIFPKEKLPVIIFDDFTTAIKFVNFPFKVKSSAMKILHAKKNEADIRFMFYKMLTIKFSHDQHKRYWISECSNLKIPLPSLKVQKQIVAKLSAAQEYKSQLLAQKSKLKELFDSVLSKSMHSKL